jgi:peptidoglycan hydrolase FlgJ
MNNQLAIDTQSLGALKGRASRDPEGAVKEAAKQFETLFMQEVMKRMRAASLDSGLLDNETTKLGTDMLDQQYAQTMSGLPGGLSAAIERQLNGGLKKAGETPLSMQNQAPATLPDLAKKNVPQHAARFIVQHDAAAKAVAAESGIPANFMLAQAAHETGWGRAQIKNADGSSANNLFGIKAGPNWTGKVAQVTTTEYSGGVAHKVVAKFRAYDSPEDSFRDYAKLMTGNRRYAAALESARQGAPEATQFAQHLQKAGYATDPAYADKLARVINTTVRVQRALA